MLKLLPPSKLSELVETTVSVTSQFTVTGIPIKTKKGQKKMHRLKNSENKFNKKSNVLEGNAAKY